MAFSKVQTMRKTSNWTLFGAGNFIFDIIDAIQANGEKVACLVLNQKLEANVAKLLPEEIEILSLNKFQPKTTNYFIAFIDPNKERLLGELSKFNIKFANIIHPSAYVAQTVILGQGNFFGAGSVVGPEVRIGKFNIINRVASIGHNVEVGDFNHFGPASTICGRCLIGNRNFFGASSTLIDGLKVRNQILLGAGALATTDLIKSGTYIGAPAKILKRS